MRSPVICIAIVASVLAGCTDTSVPHHDSYYGVYVENLPKQKTFHLNWTEPVRFGTVKVATFQVKRLDVGPRGWTATVSFRNDSSQTLTLAKGGKQSPRDWGLGVLTSELSPRLEVPGNYLIKARISPPLPSALRAGESWAGTFSSPQPPRSLRTLRFVFGTFFWKGKPPGGLGPYFVYVTSHFVHAPPPQGLPRTTTTTS